MRALILIALLLAACSSGGQTPAPPVPSPPASRPGAVAFTADWSQFAFSGTCTEAVPPDCRGDGWLTFNMADTYATGGAQLTYAMPWAGYGGLPVIRSGTYPGAVSVEAVVSATCDSNPGCYAGPVVYNGELNYRALYLDKAGDLLRVRMYGPTYAQEVSTDRYQPGSAHTLRLDYDNGTWTYYVDGRHLLTETLGSLSADNTYLLSPPRVALWLGSTTATIGRFDVYTEVSGP